MLLAAEFAVGFDLSLVSLPVASQQCDQLFTGRGRGGLTPSVPL